MAVESPLVTVEAISAVDFPELIRRYRVTGVPKTVVNDRNELLGALPEEAFLTEALDGLIPTEPPSTT